jgi:hypothetical protein
MIPAEIISEFKKIGRKQNHGFLYHSDSAKNQTIKTTKFSEIPENGSAVDECVRVFNDAVPLFDDVVINGFYVYEKGEYITSFNVFGLKYKDGVLYSEITLISLIKSNKLSHWFDRNTRNFYHKKN